MPNIGLGQYPQAVFASRTINGNGQYMPDSTTILSKSGGATSDDWGTAELAGLNGTTDGFSASPTQDITVQFIGNSGNGVIQEYDPVSAGWVTKIIIDDALAHVIRAPLRQFRIGMATHAGTTRMTLETSRQTGQV
jgi:hypothetical protein